MQEGKQRFQSLFISVNLFFLSHLIVSNFSNPLILEFSTNPITKRSLPQHICQSQSAFISILHLGHTKANIVTEIEVTIRRFAGYLTKSLLFKRNCSRFVIFSVEWSNLTLWSLFELWEICTNKFAFYTFAKKLASIT